MGEIEFLSVETAVTSLHLPKSTITPSIFNYLSIAKRANVLSLILLRYSTSKKFDFSKAFDDFKAFVSLRVLKIEKKIFLQWIYYHKIVGVTV